MAKWIEVQAVDRDGARRPLVLNSRRITALAASEGDKCLAYVGHESDGFLLEHTVAEVLELIRAPAAG